jgi:asparagine synthase (glutamine-hydrolysing)
MCGIAGCVARPGERPDDAALRRMADAIAHRGPDDTGVEVVDSVGLVHTRLAIVDPSPAGHAPMEHPDGDWWLTYNGEVFNHVDLRAELPEVPWRGGSDTETLLHALAAWGEDAIPRCNGLFAYAALDRRRRRLLLVRDRFGVKPLYWARHAGRLWFASEMRPLLEVGIPRVPRADVLAHAVEVGWANGPLTPVEAIARVTPGTFLEVDLDTLVARERRWYEPVETVDAEWMAALAKAPRPQLVAAVEDALRTSVRRRLMADVPVGTMCSGGLDSSLVTAFAAEAGTVHAFNAAVVDQPGYDEGPWARRVADALGVELHTVELTAESWRAGLVETVRHIEYPLNHESSVPMAQIAGRARNEGMKVLLSGEGADELFGGYGWLHHHDFADFAARRRPAQRAARTLLRALQRRGVLAARTIPDPRPGPGPGVNAYERATIDRGIGAYAHHRRVRRRLEGKLAADLGLYLPHLLNRQDKSTMMRSIETRVPFLDPDLVALALNLPLEARLEPERKAPLRTIAARRLPPGVARREKLGFGFEVGPYLDDAVRPDFLAEGRLREVLGRGADEWRREAPAMLGALLPLSAEIWCRAVLDGEAVEEVEEALWKPGAARAAAAARWVSG